jgi:hypothetical protein
MPPQSKSRKRPRVSTRNTQEIIKDPFAPPLGFDPNGDPKESYESAANFFGDSTSTKKRIQIPALADG